MSVKRLWFKCDCDICYFLHFHFSNSWHTGSLNLSLWTQLFKKKKPQSFISTTSVPLIAFPVGCRENLSPSHSWELPRSLQKMPGSQDLWASGPFSPIHFFSDPTSPLVTPSGPLQSFPRRSCPLWLAAPNKWHFKAKDTVLCHWQSLAGSLLAAGFMGWGGLWLLRRAAPTHTRGICQKRGQLGNLLAYNCS